MAKWSTGSVDAAIEEDVQKLGLDSLKEKQMEAARSFASIQDTLVCLPTGYDKSIIYAMLPYVFDELRGKLLLPVSSTA